MAARPPPRVGFVRETSMLSPTCFEQLCGIAVGPDNGGIEKSMLNADPHGFLYRIVAVVAGLAIIGFGVGPLLHAGNLFGTN